MTTYSVRCRHHACRHRRVTERHPDTYIRPPACTACGHRKGWRLEPRDYNRRGLCRCDGPTMTGGKHFPHQPTHPLCDQHPSGPYNQAKRRGVPDDDIPLEHMPATPCTTEQAPF